MARSMRSLRHADDVGVEDPAEFDHQAGSPISATSRARAQTLPPYRLELLPPYRLELMVGSCDQPEEKTSAEGEDGSPGLGSDRPGRGRPSSTGLGLFLTPECCNCTTSQSSL